MEAERLKTAGYEAGKRAGAVFRKKIRKRRQTRR